MGVSSYTIAKMLGYGNWVLALILTTLAIKLASDLVMSKPVAPAPYEWERYPPPMRPEFKLYPLEYVRASYETPVLEEAPPKEVSQRPPDPKPPVSETPVPAPFLWAGGSTCLDNPQKSYVILQDERTQQQFLIRQGEMVSQTGYQVMQITPDQAKLQRGNVIAIVERPKPWLTATRPDGKTVVAGQNKPLTIQNNKVMIANVQEFGQLGLVSQDQIIAIDGRRVYNLSQLEESIANSGKATTELSVLRQGRIVAIALPKEAFSQLLAANRK